MNRVAKRELLMAKIRMVLLFVGLLSGIGGSLWWYVLYTHPHLDQFIEEQTLFIILAALIILCAVFTGLKEYVMFTATFMMSGVAFFGIGFLFTFAFAVMMVLFVPVIPGIYAVYKNFPDCWTTIKDLSQKARRKQQQNVDSEEVPVITRNDVPSTPDPEPDEEWASGQTTEETPQAAQQIWYCPKCGRKNEDLFCPVCGIGKPD